MKKIVKITSGILACTLALTNASVLDITKANELSSINVSSENSNISAQIQSKDNKNYLVVTAMKDVTNVAVRVNVSNNQTFVFKHSELKQGETVHFELDIADKKQEVSKKKVLPKTDVVREKLEVRGVVKGFTVVAIVSYDVEKVQEKPLEKLENNKSAEEGKLISEKTQSEKIETKPTTEVKEETNPTVETTKEVNIAAEAKIAEEKHADAWEKAAAEASVKGEANTAAEAKAKEDAHSDAWEKAATENKKSSEVVNAYQPKGGDTTPAVEKKVEVTPAESAKKVEEAQADAWEKAATKNNLVNPNLSESKDESAVLVDLLNKHRIANGKKPLVVDNSLAEGTLVRANEFAALAVSGKTGMALHLRLDEKSSFNTVFPTDIRAKLGENVSYGTRLESLMKFWTNSPAHNKNMLSDEYTKVSIKVVKQNGMYYGVQIFSK